MSYIFGTPSLWQVPSTAVAATNVNKNGEIVPPEPKNYQSDDDFQQKTKARMIDLYRCELCKSVMELDSSSSDVPPESTLERSIQESESSIHGLVLPSACATFTRRHGRYIPTTRQKLRNNLLAGVGFLELGNCGDFAANVWNTIPLPPYAVALMAVGGTLALLLSYFAFRDTVLSWRNIVNLRQECRDLQRQKAFCRDEDGQMLCTLDTLLELNLRETGTELVNRIGMDICMGFAGILVSAGTFLAIGGANHRVWQASNLLSGYIGNVPLALFGLINAAWFIYVFIRVRQHGNAGAKILRVGSVASRMLRCRVRTIQIYNVVVGMSDLVSGAGSLITATRWWGYAMLIPVIVSSISCNYIWRHKIGYERPLVQRAPHISLMSLLKELEFVQSVQQILEEMPSESLRKVVVDPQSIGAVVEFLKTNDLFEDFCLRLLGEAQLAALFRVSETEVRIDSQSLVTIDKIYVPRVLEIAQMCVSESGLLHFQYRERYLTEMLGYYLERSQAEISKEMDMHLEK